MDTYHALVYEPSNNEPDSISSREWKSFTFQLDERIRELERHWWSARTQILAIPGVVIVCFIISLIWWPPGVVVALVLLPCYTWLAPSACNPIKRARQIGVHIDRWHVERARQTALDARISSS